MSKILTLDGCRPTPLANYLKALGVLRLVSEQKDHTARGFWQHERFHLKTTLEPDSLRRFFLEDYAPTSIVAPWNGGSGFYPKDAKDGISAIEESTSDRFENYRSGIATCGRLIAERRLGERPTDAAKTGLIAAVRAEGDEKTVAWLDAAVALTVDRTAFPPLLGTGGNDGRLDFTNNFMQRLTELIDVATGGARAGAAALLDDALFALPAIGLSSAAVGQFSPGAAGGANSTSGYEGSARVNSWDFVLMLEGALVFAGSVSRRLEGADPAYLSYPFTVRAAGAGFGTASIEEQAEARGELWAPLWSRAATLAEVRALFREGRLSVGARLARDGLDAARAIASLGADRRISSFERYGFVKRQGLAYLATPLGRRLVRPNPAGELVSELDRGRWLDTVRGKGTGADASAELSGSVRELEDSLFDLVARPRDPLVVQAILIAVGRIVRSSAERPKLWEAVPPVRPPPRLTGAWIAAADDESPEFRLAVSLAGVRARLLEESSGEGGGRFGLYMRQHFAPLDPEANPDHPAWSAEKGGAAYVWGAGGLVRNLCAVAQRRTIEHTRSALPDKPFDAAFGVASGEIADFLDASGSFDNRIAALLAGLVWVRPAPWRGDRLVAPLPFSYAALKPLFVPRAALIRLGYESLDLPMPAALPGLLMAGQLEDAIRLGQERVRASGLPTPFLSGRRSGTARRPDMRFGQRLLATLIVPVADGVLRSCFEQAYPLDEEETDNAA
ncbi:MAG: type I-U CRISPR-associated protein Csx17 [Methylobacteriaceae bacterium]|nr:type I-U CRISPR-associated protein Csx17 [Methylobacteriaceae bacterium]